MALVFVDWPMCSTFSVGFESVEVNPLDFFLRERSDVHRRLRMGTYQTHGLFMGFYMLIPWKFKSLLLKICAIQKEAGLSSNQHCSGKTQQDLTHCLGGAVKLRSKVFATHDFILDDADTFLWFYAIPLILPQGTKSYSCLRHFPHLWWRFNKNILFEHMPAK